jgi:hypothetical protein
MSKVINIAKFTFAFVVIAGGFSIIIGSLMGGGASRSYDKMRGVNSDPRSVLVQAVLIETDAQGVASIELPAAGAQLSDAAFAELLSDAGNLRDSGEARVRTPAILVQHEESGGVTVKLGDRVFNADISPSVIDTKHGPVLRVALQINRIDSDSSATPRELSFATAYTTAPGSTVVLDLAGLGLDESRAVLALRTSLSDPTPRQNN